MSLRRLISMWRCIIENVALRCRRSRVCARDDGKGQERAVKKGSGNNGLRVRERLCLIGLGARAMADMGEGRPPCAEGP